jgi:hypothetical protein
MSKAGFARLERYELKYHIPLEMVSRLDAFLLPWCSLDSHSENSETGFYWVSSLYLDSPRWTFFKWKEAGQPDRFNMRIRAYGENPSPHSPRFFEVKRKRGDVVTKTRDEERFHALSTTYNASPVLLTQYRRKAWFGVHEDYARVTVDMGLRWREEQGFDFSLQTDRMRPSDLPEYFRPGTNAVLELKCPKGEVPWWMLDLIRFLDLQRTSFSKYGVAVREYHRIPTIRAVR